MGECGALTPRTRSQREPPSHHINPRDPQITIINFRRFCSSYVSRGANIHGSQMFCVERKLLHFRLFGGVCLCWAEIKSSSQQIIFCQFLLCTIFAPKWENIVPDWPWDSLRMISRKRTRNAYLRTRWCGPGARASAQM